MTEKYEDFYRVDEPSEQSWWDEFTAHEDIHGVMRVFYEAGVEPVCNDQENYIAPREDAFTETDYQQIHRAAENIYGRFAEFVEQVEESSVHPQQTRQITKAQEYEQIDKEFPIKFGPYDGMAVTEGIQTDYQM